MEMFKEVRDEIDKAGALNVTERTTNNEKLRFKLSSVGEVSNDVLDVSRLSALTAYANNFIKVAYEKTRCFDEIVDDIFNLQLKYEKKGDPSSACCSSAKKISDPSVVKTKGAPKKKKFSKKTSRHCSNCTGAGHIIRTCPNLGGVDVKAADDDHDSHSESSGYDITHNNDKSETGFDACNNQDPQHSQQLSGNNIKKIEPMNCSGGGIPNIPQAVSTYPQMNIPRYGYGPMNEGIPMKPHYVEGSFNPQTSQVPIFSQPPQYYAPISNVNNGTSWNDLLQHVMHNIGASSSSNNMKTS
ncbi:Zinc finger, CCHC-type superfamily [Sesbania bispinosa]|nr:Zinc finger, CCHC-type superfamily [Sesbania bispinosa]